MTPLLTLALRNEQDVVAVRQRARQIAAGLGFDSQDQVRVATAVSEIGRNAFTFAGGGTVEFHVDMKPPALVVKVSDGGPGIADLAAVLEGRYQSPTGMGLGILGARRLMDDCDIDSRPGKGTNVRMAKRLPRSATLTTAALAGLTDQLVAQPTASAYQEVRQQNRELLLAVAEVSQRQEELVRVNRELEDTNRGVVALYAELDEKADSLRRADESKTRFLSNMGHEFRTPLNSIRGLTRLLLDRVDGPLSDEQEKQVRFIRRAADDLSSMVDDLLDLAKIEAGRVEVRATQFTVDDLFSALRGMLRPLLISDSVRLVFEDPKVGEALFTDEGKLSQILRNFVSNALKFTEQGEVRVRAEHASAHTMRFVVSDTGIGIDPRDHERIFEEFTQIDNPLQKRIKGTGLGLPLCRRLATLLGGSVGLESAAGAGSSFYVVLPIRFPASAAPAATAVTEGHNPTVLIIDDEEAARYVMRKLLSEYAFEVIEASDGPSGIDSARNALPDLIFLDIRMPGQDGGRVLAELKADPRTASIPVVIVSSVAVDEAERAEYAAAAAILRKSALTTRTLRAVLAQTSMAPAEGAPSPALPADARER